LKRTRLLLIFSLHNMCLWHSLWHVIMWCPSCVLGLFRVCFLSRNSLASATTRAHSREQMSLARLRKELQDIEKDREVSGVHARVRGDDMTKLQGTLKGPEDTCYAGGMFVVDIQIPSQYPFEPPKMRFETKMWHPNVSSQTGAICLDILKDKWSPALTVKTALVSLQALLSCPEPDDPQDAEVANMYKTDRAGFEQKAAEWTATHAMGKGNSEKVNALVGMGFPEDRVRQALLAHNGDQQQALEALLSG
jgi:ubiquitin-conjugating enzyme (huntingtin interacting protein 2)